MLLTVEICEIFVGGEGKKKDTVQVQNHKTNQKRRIEAILNSLSQKNIFYYMRRAL